MASLASNVQNISAADNNDRAVLDECVAVLNRNVHAIAKLSVDYSVRRDFPPDYDGMLVGVENVRLLLDNGRFHYRSELARPGGREPLVEEFSFDGHTFFKGIARKRGTSSVRRLMGDNPDDEETHRKFFRDRYLESVGFALPETPFAWKTSSVESIVVRNLEKGNVSNVEFDSKVLRMDIALPDLSRRLKFQLDREHGYAVTSREDYTTDGKLIQSFRCEGFGRFRKDELSLPGSCTMREYGLDKEMKQLTAEPIAYEVEVSNVAFDVPSDFNFALSYEPGSVVIERSTEEAKESPSGKVLYQVPASHDEMRNAAKGLAGQSRIRNWFVAINVLVIVVIVALAVLYWKRSKQ
jgi:hypothetical protein